ncbi:hypothetical protein N0V91_007277 [Didymella pomorum]|uniref:Uncharacterized protein n=1 Tax=Didymella pomorum TaxID=749634 RepID=A0A9W8ZDN6_9PLEO|nr:hypothetical protein N0V91_007277 [Didymella pomorum]
MRVIAALLCVVSQVWTVNANVEKTIFLGPSAVTLPEIHPSLDDLHLQSLSRLDSVLPTQLAVQFPSKAEPHGLESWYLLSDLEEGRRYEVRICWPATSLLFLRVQAAASYYSTDRTLMDYPPPVDVDIILDPFLLNVLPRSLAPVGLYITGIAVASWFVSDYIYRWLLSVVEDPSAKAHSD